MDNITARLPAKLRHFKMPNGGWLTIAAQPKPPAKWMHFKGSRSHLVREGGLYSLCNIGASGQWLESGQYGNRCKVCQRLGGAK